MYPRCCNEASWGLPGFPNFHGIFQGCMAHDRGFIRFHRVSVFLGFVYSLGV